MPRSALRSKALSCVDKYLAISENHDLTVCLYKKGEMYVLDGADRLETAQYDIGSVSKTMCAHLILHLADQGLLSLDDSVDKYVRLKKGKYPSLRRLLTHTAGYGHLTPVEITLPQLVRHGYARKNVYDGCNAETVKRCLERRRRCKQHGDYGYSDFAFAVLAVVAEEVTHAPFAALFEDFVQNELGLKSTVIAVDPEARYPKAASGKRILPFWRWGRENPYIASGGLVTTGADMLRYVALQIESEKPYIVKAHTLAKESLTARSNEAMCLGWHSYKKSNQLWHVGGVGTFRSSLIANRKARFGVVVLGNAKGISSANVHYLAKMLYSENKIRKIDYSKACYATEI